MITRVTKIVLKFKQMAEERAYSLGQWVKDLATAKEHWHL